MGCGLDLSGWTVGAALVGLALLSVYRRRVIFAITQSVLALVPIVISMSYSTEMDWFRGAGVILTLAAGVLWLLTAALGPAIRRYLGPPSD